MLFRNEESSLRLDIVNYEFPPDGGTKGIQTFTADVEKLVLTPRRCTIMARSLFNINRK